MVQNENHYFKFIGIGAFKRLEKSDPRTLAKIISLIVETTSNPFSGTGKPEPLKHSLKGKWSRRITQEHRLVYEVKADTIWIVSCRFPYD